MNVRLRPRAVLVTGVLLAAGSPAGMHVAATSPVNAGARLGAGVTIRVSVADDGAQANEKSGEPAISAGGRFVAFVSKATNLVPGDTNGALDVFVRDRRNGTTQLVSASSSGVQGNGRSGDPSISSDGRFVAFWSFSSNLVPGDTNDRVDVFVRDLQTETTERVSIGDDEAQIENRVNSHPVISGNGRLVIFQSYSPYPGPSAPPEAFVRDRAAGTTQSIHTYGEAAISQRGRFLAFSTVSRLRPNDTDDALDVYVLDRQTGSTRQASTTGFHTDSEVSMSGNGRFVAYLASPIPKQRYPKQVFVRDMWSKTAKIASVNSRGVPGDGGSAQPTLSRDGHYIAFWSYSHNLAPRAARQLVYGHDLRTGVTRVISVNSRGERAWRQPRGGPRVTIAVSATGRAIAFISPATNLVPNDTNGWADVFVRLRR